MKTSTLVMGATLLTVVSPSAARASECVGISVGGPTTDQKTLRILTAQAGRPVTSVSRLRLGAWSIYTVSADGERAHIFFNGQPRYSPKAYLWGGVAQPSEYGDVLSQVRSHARGIPNGLATCFAHRVTGAKW